MLIYYRRKGCKGIGMRNQNGKLKICLIVLSMFLASCGAKEIPSEKVLKDNDLLVTLDSRAILYADYKNYCSVVVGTPAENVQSPAERQHVATSMVNDIVLAEDASKKGLDKTDAFKARMEILNTKILPPVYVAREFTRKMVVTDNDLKKYIKDEPQRIQLQAFVSDNEAKCYDALRRVQAGEDFGEIIKGSSEGITKEKRGDVGYVAVGSQDLFLADEQKYFRDLNVGEFSKVFKTRIGYMLVKVTDILTPEAQFRKTADTLRDRVKLEKERDAYKVMILGLRKREKARLDERNLARIGSGKLAGLTEAQVHKLPVAWIGKEPVPFHNLVVLGATDFHSPKDLRHILEGHLDSLITARVAKKMGLDADPEVRKQYDMLSRNSLARIMIDDLSRNITVSDEDFRSYYDSHLSEFKIPETVKLSVVEVKNRMRADQALSLLGKGKPFDEVVREVSDDLELKKTGGDIGYFPPEVLLGEMKALLPKMKVGDTSPVVKVAVPKEKYLIFRVTDRKPAGTADFPSIKREVIRPRIVAQKRASAIKEYMEQVGKTHKVSWNREIADILFKTGAKEAGK